MEPALTIRYCTICGTQLKQAQANKFVCAAGHINWLDAVPGAVLFVVNAEHNAVLYGVRSIGWNAGKLCAPGGHIDLGETAEQAAIREAREEMGIEVELVDILRTYSAGYEDRWVLNVVFIAKHVSGVPIPADDMSGGQPQWRSTDNLPQPDELAWPWYNQAQKDLVVWLERHKPSVLPQAARTTTV
jgi:mutator protein MutT